MSTDATPLSLDLNKTHQNEITNCDITKRLDVLLLHVTEHQAYRLIGAVEISASIVHTDQTPMTRMILTSRP